MWGIILIVFALVIIAFLKFEHYKKTFHICLLVIFLILIYFSMNAMMQTGQMDFTSPKGTINSVGVYFSWLGQTSIKLFSIGKDTVRTVGNVVLTNSTTTK